MATTKKPSSLSTFPTPEKVKPEVQARNKTLLTPQAEPLRCCGGLTAPYLTLVPCDSDELK
ncbi:MAG: hypothetical protein CMN80_09655 [Spongiibacter sp.]|uniref:hypothetical protein n=1 Tax=Spongiibacter sp. TaxID=2024860 RepID=UPI000C0ABB0A|nr:hypothetical protein [Spongiibacter sp.]MAK44400.1 hypothetical protein [Spongiibacter sp.]